jgi:hypothetical protein
LFSSAPIFYWSKFFHYNHKKVVTHFKTKLLIAWQNWEENNLNICFIRIILTSVDYDSVLDQSFELLKYNSDIIVYTVYRSVYTLIWLMNDRLFDKTI